MNFCSKYLTDDWHNLEILHNHNVHYFLTKQFLTCKIWKHGYDLQMKILHPSFSGSSVTKKQNSKCGFCIILHCTKHDLSKGGQWLDVNTTFFKTRSGGSKVIRGTQMDINTSKCTHTHMIMISYTYLPL